MSLPLHGLDTARGSHLADGVPYPSEGDPVRVRLDPGGDWYDGTVVPVDSLHFTVKTVTDSQGLTWLYVDGEMWRYGDYGETWSLYAHQLTVDGVVTRVEEVLECSSS